MTISEKLITIANNSQKVYDKGFSDGKTHGGTDWLYYATRINNVFGGTVFPENTEFVARVKGAIDYSYMFNNCLNLKSVKIITETPDIILNMTAFCAIGSSSTPTLELVDFSEFNKHFGNTYNMCSNQKNLKKIIGAMDLTHCTNTQFMFRNNNLLENVEFVEGTIPISISFADCPLLTAESYNSIMSGLSTATTGQTLSLPNYNTVKTIYDTKYGTGSWDNLTAEKENWSFSYN